MLMTHAIVSTKSFQDVVNAIHNWVSECYRFNTAKCNNMWLTTNNPSIATRLPSLFLGLDSVEKVEYLGLILSSDLQWSSNIAH